MSNLCFLALHSPGLAFLTIANLPAELMAERLQHIQSVFLKYFPPCPEKTKEGFKWKSKRELGEHLSQVAQQLGLAISSSSGKTHNCSRAAAVPAQAEKHKRKKKSGSLSRNFKTTKCQRGFHLVVTVASQTLSNQLDIPCGSVCITRASCLHTNGCMPSSSQLVAEKRHTGAYQKAFDSQQWGFVVKLVATRPHVSSVILRNAARQLFPKRVGLDANLLSNLRIKARAIVAARELSPEDSRVVPQMEAGYLLSDDLVAPPSFLGSPIDENNAPFLDQASLYAREELRSILRESKGETTNLKLFLARLHEMEPGFTYEMCFDNNGYLVAFCWMSPVQRRNFEIFGRTLCLDMMKRETNSQHWPYTTICTLNEMKKVVSCGEAFCCQEQIDAYVWALQSIASQAPGRPLSTIRCIFGDGIFDGDSVVIQQQETANNGDTVVALIENQFATLKKYYLEKDGTVRLQPANSEMDPIIVSAENLTIQGKVTGIIRRYN